MVKRSISAMLVALVLPLPAVAESAAPPATTESPWVSEARAQWEQARRAMAAASNEQTRTAWQSRVVALEGLYSNACAVAALEANTRAATGGQFLRSEYMLRRALAAVEMDTATAESAVKDENAIIRKLKARRRALDERDRSRRQPAETTEEPGEPSALQQQIQALDAETLLHMLMRDTAETRIRLAREATRVDDARRAMDLTATASLRLIVGRRQDAVLAHQKCGEFAAIRDDVAKQRKEARDGIALCRQSVQRLDERLKLLSKWDQVLRDTQTIEAGGAPERRGILRLPRNTDAQRDIRRQSDEIAGRKEQIAAQITHLQAQTEVTDELLTLLDQGCTLFMAEESFRREDFSALRSRYLRRVLVPAVVSGGLIALHLLFSLLIFPLLLRRDSLFLARRAATYLLVVLLLGVLVGFFLEDLKAIATVMGIVGAAVVIALQDMCSAFAGWFAIVSSRKIRVGDRVEIDGVRGEVLDIQVLRTTLEELNNWLGVNAPTGRTVIIPNSFIFKSHVFNYSRIHPFIWGKLDVQVTYETALAKAYDALIRILREECAAEYQAAAEAGKKMIRHYGADHASYEPCVHMYLEASGITLRMLYPTHYTKESGTRDRLLKRVVEVFDKDPDLDFAYPTERHIATPPGGKLAKPPQPPPGTEPDHG
jgi:small-conductance mechanosensitive channel